MVPGARVTDVNRNVGGVDRTARIVGGAALVVQGGLVFGGVLPVGAFAGATALLAGVALLVTGATCRCPANHVAGIDTSEE